MPRDELFEMQALLSACDSSHADVPLDVAACEYLHTPLNEHRILELHRIVYIPFNLRH